MTRAEGQLLNRELADAAKNWLAIDGLWFQAIEQEYGMETALEMDRRVWEQFSVIEARRILTRLNLSHGGGLDALETALNNRLFHLINELQIVRPDKNTLILTMKTCRVHAARERKKMPLFPCKSIGLVDFPLFAHEIDARITTECVSCPPESLPGIPYCSWKFSISDSSTT